MNKYIIYEQENQATYWGYYKAANIVAGFVTVITFLGGGKLAIFFAVVQLIFNAWKVPQLKEHFYERMRMVTFSTQLDNLYVYSITPDLQNDPVVATFKSTIDTLKEVGNKHEVRVHLILFRDVQVFTWWHDAAGNLQRKKTDRDKGSSYETWEQYQSFCRKFEQEDREERLREIRKDQKGFDWVNENFFNQYDKTY